MLLAGSHALNCSTARRASSARCFNRANRSGSFSAARPSARGLPLRNFHYVTMRVPVPRSRNCRSRSLSRGNDFSRQANEQKQPMYCTA